MSSLHPEAVQEIRDSDSTLLAVVIRCGWLGLENGCGYGTHFFTSPDNPMQVGWMRHPKGKIIPAHRHQPIQRIVSQTTEALLIKSGILKVSIYGVLEVQTVVLYGGDVILLYSGGHGFEVEDEVQMWEVRTGPYPGKEIDKIFLCPIKE